MKGTTEKQKAARQLIGSYLPRVMEQELLVNRIVEAKLAQMRPQVEQYIKRIVDEQLSARIQAKQ